MLVYFCLSYISDLLKSILYLLTLKFALFLYSNFHSDRVVNSDYIKINENNTCSDFFYTMISQSLFPQITLPTRLSNTNATLIDNLFCKFDYTTNKTNSGILLNNLFDHQPYFILLNIKGTKACHITNTKHIKVYIPTKTAVRNILSDMDASDFFTIRQKTLI